MRGAEQDWRGWRRWDPVRGAGLCDVIPCQAAMTSRVKFVSTAQSMHGIFHAAAISYAIVRCYIQHRAPASTYNQRIDNPNENSRERV